MPELEKNIQLLVAQYGYHAVPFALLTDPAGIPWAWVFLLLLAEEAGKNIALMLVYGFAVLMAFDHILYWVGALGGQKLVRKICAKKPDWAPLFEATRENIHKRGALAVIFGRYLPLVGRWMGIGAGLSAMNYAKFSLYDAIGAAISAFGFGLVAHFVGRKTIENPNFYPIVLSAMVFVTVVSVAGVGISWWKSRQNREVEPVEMREVESVK
ncbi:membrane protein DedA, SNARE-associated domain [Abditibacterium utsteinense]|uniref:Membrane protein DedA, SNARE-associated domain n=1 Tax=Abditibacterium utsteinense TaxID=1960156 RepID=A0A2S8SWR6_9BACT|nr:DedA family protein [Abditibacterium utsteinense]PQV65242.1 membrane protein DedA, SNARE-associated domain [Abditibacterium utsteinense]